MMTSFLISFPMELFVALSFGEVCSAFPKNGSCYYWSIRLVKEEYKKFISYIVGWFYIGGGLLAWPIGYMQ